MNFKLLFLVLLFSCKKENNVPIKVMGHAGAGLEFSGSVYHGNSMEAMNYALNMPNCDGVEMDLRMAADGSLWLSHDETLDNETNSHGCVGDKLAEELSSIRYKTLKKEKLAKLTDVEIFWKGKKTLFLDIKHANFCKNTTQNQSLFLANLNDWRSKLDNPSERVYLIVNNPDWIAGFIAAGWNVLYSSDDWAVIQQLIIEYPALEGFVCKNAECSENEVQQFVSAGKSIYLYEVRSPKALKEVRKKRPTGVISDDLQGALVEFK